MSIGTILKRNDISLLGFLITFLCSLAISCCTILGMEYSESGYAEFDVRAFAITSTLGIGLCIAVILLLHLFLTIRQSPDYGLLNRVLILQPRWSAKSILIHAGVMFVCWLPYALIYFPGTMGFDTFYQIFQFYPNHGPILLIPWESTNSWILNHFCDHHPFFDTLLFGSFAYVSDRLFGTWNYGIFALAVIQMACMSCTFTLSCAYMNMRKIGTPLLRFLAYVFFCLFPVIPMYSVTVIKDSLFSWIFVLWFLAIVELSITQGGALNSKRRAIAFIAVSLLLCLTKKTGIYVVVAGSVVLLLCLKKNRVKILCEIFTCVFTMFVFLPHLVFPIFDVAEGGKQESLGILFQQTARYCVDNGDDVTESEKVSIDALLPFEKLATLYDPQNSDPVKYAYKWYSTTQDDLLPYLRTWASQGMRHPETYVKCQISILARYFDPSCSILLYTNQGPEIDRRSNASFLDQAKSQREAFQSAYSRVVSAPVIGILFSNVLYGLWIPLISIALFFLKRTDFRADLPKRKQLIPIASVILLLIASYLISPVFMSRYLLPLIYIAPLLLCLAQYPYSGTAVSERSIGRK